MKNLLTALAVGLISFLSNTCILAQGVSVSETNAPPNPSAMLDVQSTSKGLLPPRMTTAERDAIIAPATGLQIFNTDCRTINFNAGTPEAPQWATVSSSNFQSPAVTISSSPAGAVCEGTSVTYSTIVLNGGPSPTYQWKRNNEDIPGETNSTYTSVSPLNGDVISCTITSNAPCASGATATSNTVAEIVNAPDVAAVSISADPSGSVCAGTEVTFSATPSNGGSLPGYQWMKNGVEISGATSSAYQSSSLANGDQITCEMISGLTCVSGSPATSNTITMTILPQPSSSFTPLSITQTFPVAFAADIPGDTYSWTFQGGSISSSTDQNPVVSWAAQGSYAVSLTLTANTGCSSTTTTNVTVGPVTTSTFSATSTGPNGSIQTFTVPSGVSLLMIEASGAQGGTAYQGSNNFVGGLGARMKGAFAVTPGQVLKIVVGQQGGSNSSYNSGGGGGSFVWLDPSNTLLIAAGGGGGGGNFPDGNEHGSTSESGNRGGQIVGAYNGGGTGYGTGGTSGNGGNGGAGGSGPGSNGGGAGWLSSGNGSGFGTTKFSFTGGTGGSANGGFGGGAGQGGCCGGGGGGGYSGGGGSGWASSSPNCNAPGGGGGSFNSGTNQINTGGVQSGHGLVTISY